MATTILESVKEYCEVDDTNDFDNQLLGYIAEAVGYLYNNSIPVIMVDDTTTAFPEMNDFEMSVAQAYLNLYCLRNFDREMIRASIVSNNWVDIKLLDLLHQLKCLFDAGD